MIARLRFCVAALLMLEAEAFAEPPPLFTQVARTGDVILARLGSDAQYFVQFPNNKWRLTRPGQSIAFHDSDIVMLSQAHSHFQVTCHIAAPQVGLTVESSVDARPFGGQLWESTYFVKAK
jgi:hypothetical protein